jgi:hypothetical protein
MNMAQTITQPFSQFTNWFALEVTAGPFFRIPTEEGKEPAAFFFQHAGAYYSFMEEPGAQQVTPDVPLLRRVAEMGIRDCLRTAGFDFKGLHGYIAYYKRSQFHHPCSDIFSVYTGFEFRVIDYCDGEDQRIFFVLDPHIVFITNQSIADLVVRGAPAELFNGHAVKVHDLAAEQRGGIDFYILDVTRDEGGKVFCEVCDARSSKKEIRDGAVVYIEPRPEVLQAIIDSLKVKFDVVEFQRRKSFLASPIASRDRFGKTQEIVNDFLIKKLGPFPLHYHGFAIDLVGSPVPVTGSRPPLGRKLSEPAMLFDASDSSAIHLQAYWGLRNFGPYTKTLPTIRLGLLGPPNGIQALEVLVKDLNRGTRIMQGGMPQFFRSNLEIVDREKTGDASIEACLSAAEALGSRAKRKLDVVLVHMPHRFSEFDYNSPYYYVKPRLLELGIPTQMITPLALSNPEWKHANIASALFAKAGGHPWVLADDLTSFDLIIGVGLSQAISKTKRAGGHPRFVGFANVFDQLGRWMFFETTHEAYDADNPEQQLAELILNAVQRYERDKKTPPQSIAVHYYKRFGRKERDRTIAALSKKYAQTRIAFVTIDKSHPMRLYDTNTEDGSFPRGHYAQLSDTELLLSTTGFTDLARKRMGTPQVLKISVQYHPAPFVELADIAKQVFALTKLNYKTLSPTVGEPVTLLFANLVAKFTAVFSETQWKRAAVLETGIANRVPWFL